MLTSELIDRTLSEWLYPGSDEQPAFDTLEGAIDASVLELTLAGRVDKVPRDTTLQIGSELLLVSEANAPEITLAQRGFAGSTAASHADGDLVWIDPSFTRVEILNALRSLIGKLYAWGVYRRTVSELEYTTHGTVALPAGAREVHSILIRKNTTYEDYTRLAMRGKDWIEYRELDPVQIKLRGGGAEGADMHVVCIADFTLPVDETDDLTDDCGVPEALQEDLPMAVAGTVLKARQVPRAVVDRIREALAAEGQQPGFILNVGDSLINAFRRDAVLAERRRLAELDEPAFEWQRR